MKKLLLLFLFLLPLIAYGQEIKKFSELIEGGDTAVSVNDEDFLFIIGDPLGSPDSKGIRYSTFKSQFGGTGDVNLSDSTSVFVTPTQLGDSLTNYVMLTDSNSVFVTPFDQIIALLGYTSKAMLTDSLNLVRDTLADHNIRLVALENTGSAVTSVNGQTGVVILDTDDISEGSNLYNQTHTGDVTGSVVLTITDGVIEAVNLESTNSPTDNYVPSYDASSGGFTWVENAGGGGSGTVTNVSAGDGMDFTNITTTGDVTMGTPGTLTPSTANSVTTTSHSHAIANQTTITDTDSQFPTSGAVIDYVAANAVNPADTLSGIGGYGINIVKTATTATFSADTTELVTPYYVSENTVDPADTSHLVATLPLVVASDGNNGDTTLISINTFSSTASGVVPLSGGGTSNYLRADGTWAAPSGGGGTADDTARTAAFVVSSQINMTDINQWVNIKGAVIDLHNTSGMRGEMVDDSSFVLGSGIEGMYYFTTNVVLHNPTITNQNDVFFASRVTVNSEEARGSYIPYEISLEPSAYIPISVTALMHLKEGDTLRAERYIDDPDLVLISDGQSDYTQGFYATIHYLGQHSDQASPTMTGFEIGNYNDSIIIATFDEPIDSASTTAVGEWTVSQGSTYATVSDVEFTTDYDSILIGLGADGSSDSTYNVSYSGSSIKDYARNYLATFTDSSVTNNMTSARDTIDCDADGVLSITSTAYVGEWEFYLYRQIDNQGATLADYIYYADNDFNTTNSGGYRIQIPYNEDVSHISSGVGTDITGASILTAGSWNKITIQRNSTINEYFTGAIGDIRILVNDVAFTPSSGTNPFTPNGDVSTSVYFYIEMDDGEAITGLTINNTDYEFSDMTVQSGTFSTR